MNSNRQTRTIALVGCGAISDSFYLPCLNKLRDRDSIILVDSDNARARAAAEKFNLHRIMNDYSSVLQECAGVILAVPHRLHYSMALRALDRGVHVLVEKPLTPIAEEAAGLVLLAEHNRLMLLVNNTRRLFPSYAKIREIMASGELGAPLSIDWAEGDQFQWPTASGFYFQHSNQPRGVLLDLGAHALDALCWWFGRRPEVVCCEGDSFGGPEATAHVAMRVDDCDISLRLSWLSKQRNSIRIRFERGAIEAGVWDWNTLTITHAHGSQRQMTLGHFASYGDFAQPIVENFLNIVDGEFSPPRISAIEVLPSIETMDCCYEKMRPFSLPWYPAVESHKKPAEVHR